CVYFSGPASLGVRVQGCAGGWGYAWGHLVGAAVLGSPGPGGGGGGGATTGAPRLDDLTLEEAEQLLIRRALARFDGNVSLAAKHLGVSRSALYRRLGETRDA
ncbi:MAG: helix-turn-helix domain-containing protein, partial [Gemmatimonadaceae bacterium]